MLWASRSRRVTINETQELQVATSGPAAFAGFFCMNDFTHGSAENSRLQERSWSLGETRA